MSEIAASPQPADKHGPNRYEGYFNVHFAIMDDFERAGFIRQDALAIADAIDNLVVIAGQIACKGRIIIDVHKVLEILGESDDPNPPVQTISYAYNVFVQGVGNVFRYDNVHSRDKGEFYPGHADGHHKHVFDWPNANQGDPEWVGRNGWPTLGEVLKEAMSWHAENYERLRATGIDPEEYATNPRSGVYRA